MKFFDKFLTGLGIAGAASGAMAGDKELEKPITMDETTAKVIQQEPGTSAEDALNDLMKAENMVLSPKKVNIVMPGEEKSLEELQAENDAINADALRNNEAIRASQEVSNVREDIKKMQGQELSDVTTDNPDQVAMGGK